eukprot:scaffold9124_cov101-Isochrysis_galbana.AAC.12
MPRAAASSKSECASWASSPRGSISLSTSLGRTCTCTAFARWAKRSVAIVSSMFSGSVRSVTNTAVLLHPSTNESCSSRVSLESRYGTCAPPTPAPPEDSAATTDASAHSEVLMCLASSRRRGSLDGPSTAKDFLDDSIPARSTSVSLPIRLPSSPLNSSMHKYRIACPREDRLFIFMAATVRWALPRHSADMTSSAVGVSSNVRPSTASPRLRSRSFRLRPSPRLRGGRRKGGGPRGE